MAFTTKGVFQYNLSERDFQKINDINLSASATEDREGNLWIGSLSQGVFFQPGKNVNSISGVAANASKMAFSEGRLLVLTGHKNLLAVDQDLNTETLISLPHHEEMEFLEFNENNIVIGTVNRFYVLDSTGEKINSTAKSNIFDGDLRNSFLTIAAKKPTLEVNNTGIAKINLSNQTQTLFPFKGIVNDILDWGNDSILLATPGGLFSLSGNTLKKFNASELLNVRINRLEATENELWISTSGNGLIRFAFQSKDLTVFTREDGLSSNVISEILPVDDGIWVSTTSGLNKVHFDPNGTMKIVKVLDSDGLSTAQIHDLEVFREHIFLTSDDGLHYFPIDEHFQESNDFPLIIEASIDDELNLIDGGSIPSNSETLTVKFKALVYQHKSSLEYQYRINSLRNPETHWISTKENIVNYSQLGPGSYIFQVRAKTKNSKWSPPVSLDFEVTPAYWQTWWFQGILLVLFIGITLLITRRASRNRRLKRKLANEKITAEIKALKAQINPHFLFNALNSIQSFLLSNENDLAEEYLVKYSKLMRRILDQSSLLTIPLHEELETIRLYVALEKFRMGNAFDFNVTVEDEIDQEEKIPSMIIQPFIENAIWHGVSNVDKGTIRINVSKPDLRSLLLEIEDNGKGFDPKKLKKSSKGSSLVQGRLSLLNQLEGIKSTLSVKTEIGKGTTVAILVSNKTNQALFKL